MAVVAEMAAFSHFKYIYDKYVYIKELKKNCQNCHNCHKLKNLPLPVLPTLEGFAKLGRSTIKIILARSRLE